MFRYVERHASADDAFTVWRDDKQIGSIGCRQGIVSYYPSTSRIPSLNAGSLAELKRMIELVEKSEWSSERALLEGLAREPTPVRPQAYSGDDPIRLPLAANDK
jgi:hypothetical protein